MGQGGKIAGEPLSPCPTPEGLRSCQLELEERHVLVLSFPLPQRSAPVALTPAERDIVRRVLDGASNAQIARARGRSPRTVANQLAAIFRKLGVFSRAKLAQCFAVTGLEEER